MHVRHQSPSGGRDSRQNRFQIGKRLVKNEACKGMGTEAAFTVADLHQLMWQRTKEIAKISFGCEAVNELLGGGLETKSITEIFGEYR